MTTIIVDQEPVPIEALYGSVEPIPIRPIGYVARKTCTDQGGHTGDVAEIHLFPAMARFMRGLADETSLLDGQRQGSAKGVDQVADVGDGELEHPVGGHGDLEVVAGGRLGGLRFRVHTQDEAEAAQGG